MILALFLVEGALPASPPVQHLNEIVSHAADPCRKDQKTVVVCGSRNGDSPYRLPPAARDPGFQIDGPRDSVSRERHKLMDVGGAGALQNSCSATGAASFAGCMVKDWRANDQQAGFPGGAGIGPVKIGPQ